MSKNPYEPPNVPATIEPERNEERAAALRDVRVSLLIMLVPTLYNFVWFNFSTDNRIEFSFFYVEQIVNFVGLVLLLAAIWIYGLMALELVTGGIHTIVARHSTLDVWKRALYSVFRRAPMLAVLGALLWVMWVVAFYQLQADFYTISVPVGIMAHVLAAFLYIPLTYRWYKMERSAKDRRTT